MNPFQEIILLLSEDITSFFYTLLVVGVLYFVVLRRLSIRDILDPLCILIVSSWMANSVPVFMYQNNMFFDESYFLHHCLSEGAFFLGLLLFYTKEKRDIQNKTQLKVTGGFLNSKEKLYFTVSSVLYVICMLLQYYIAGIPLFMQVSRFEIFGGGTGGLAVITSALQFPVAFLALQQIVSEKNRRNFISYFMLICIIVFSFLSDAKSALITSLGFTIYFVDFYNLKRNGNQCDPLLLRIRKGIYFLIPIGMMIPLLYKGGGEGDIDAALSMLAVRLVANGDVYALFYGTNVLNNLVYGNIFYDTLQTLLAMFRIIDYSDLIKGLGLQITAYAADAVQYWGVNLRHNVLGLIYCGMVGGIIYSFGIGALISRTRSYLQIKLFRENKFKYIFGCVLYVKICAMTADVSNAITTFVTFCLVNGLIICVVEWILHPRRVQK